MTNTNHCYRINNETSEDEDDEPFIRSKVMSLVIKAKGSPSSKSQSGGVSNQVVYDPPIEMSFSDAVNVSGYHIHI